MNILICSEFFHPSVGGAQKVALELSKNFRSKRHSISIATSILHSKQKKFEKLNNISIYRFQIKGNFINGMSGEIGRYQKFLKNKGFDVIMFYAAQQWTFDAAIEILDKIKSNIYLATCGFSRINNFRYKKYYQLLSKLLKKLNCNIVHSNNYQDSKFLKSNKIKNSVLIPNASSGEFFFKKKKKFLKKFNINHHDFNILNVSTFKFNKGQDLSILAFFFLKNKNKINLIFVGDEFSSFFYKVYLKILKSLVQFFHKNKKIYFLEKIKRENVIDIFFECRIFLFTSRIECSPLVLFESSAAGLPFVSLNVGNSKEIANWIGSGVVFSNIKNLSLYLDKLINNKKKRDELSKQGINRVKTEYNWNKISLKYLQTFKKFNLK